MPDLVTLALSKAYTNKTALGQGAVGIKGDKGEPGREVELQSNGSYIQYRYVGDSEWLNIVPLSDLKGADGLYGKDGIDGETPSFRMDNNILQYKFETQFPSDWTNLYSFESETIDHSRLTNLDFQSSGHIGFISADEFNELSIRVDNIEVGVPDADDLISSDNDNYIIQGSDGKLYSPIPSIDQADFLWGNITGNIDDQDDLNQKFIDIQQSIDNIEVGIPYIDDLISNDLNNALIEGTDGKLFAQQSAGEKGEPGFSPEITVAEETDTSYRLNIITENNTILTPNMIGPTANVTPQSLYEYSVLNGFEGSYDDWLREYLNQTPNLPWCSGYFQDRSLVANTSATVTPVFENGDNSMIVDDKFVAVQKGIYYLGVTVSFATSSATIISMLNKALPNGEPTSIIANNVHSATTWVGSVSATDELVEGGFFVHALYSSAGQASITANGAKERKFFFARIA